MKTKGDFRVWIDEDPQFKLQGLDGGSAILSIGEPGERCCILHFTQPTTMANLRSLRNVITAFLVEHDPEHEPIGSLPEDVFKQVADRAIAAVKAKTTLA